MTQFLRAVPLLAALMAAPAWAAQPDPHAGHHPLEAAEAAKPAPKPDAKPARHACPMMDGKMTSAAQAKAPKGKAADGKIMMDGKDMHCMPAPASAKPAEREHHHDDPDAAPE